MCQVSGASGVCRLEPERANDGIGRMLLLLHGKVLDAHQHPQSQPDHQTRNMALIGFNTTARIIIDVMEGDGEDTGGRIIPLCCFYSTRAARGRMQERSRVLVGDERLCRDVDVLLHAERRYRKMWIF